MVDSSVGGKTGVNHPGGKNLIGAFHQPSAVIADTDTLATLPDRQLRAGLTEIVKAALVADAKFFDWLEANLAKLLERDAAALEEAIRRSCAIKAAIVVEDEREQGRRALLNLGHTFGHAIEAGSGYGRLLHGGRRRARARRGTFRADRPDCGCRRHARARRPRGGGASRGPAAPRPRTHARADGHGQESEGRRDPPRAARRNRKGRRHRRLS